MHRAGQDKAEGRHWTGRPALALAILLSGAAWADPSGYNARGISAYDAGRHQQAITYFERAYEGAPDNATVRRNLCNAHQARANDLANEGNFQEAIRHLEIAVGVDPRNHHPLVQLGSYHLRLDRVSDAIFRLEEAIELKPGDLDAHELLGEAYYRDNDIASARAQWDYVLEMEPNRNNLWERYVKAFREESVEQDFNRTGSSHFRITYPPEMPYTLRSRMLTMLERAYIDIGRKFGGVYPPAPIHVIVYTHRQFVEATLLDGHVGAVYDGKIRVPMTDERGDYLEEGELKRRLTHEYVHVVVRHLAANSVPWWLNEGLAEAFSRELDAGIEQALAEAFAENRAFALSELEDSQLQRRKAGDLRLAYQQSHATVNHLWTRYGARRLSQMMRDLAAGAPAEEALRRNYQRTYATLESEVAAAYR